jgi:hypothetical protein
LSARVLALVLVAGCAAPRDIEPFQEHVLAVIPAGIRVIVPVAYARDGTRAAYVARTDQGDQVVFGDWKSAIHPVI